MTIADVLKKYLKLFNPEDKIYRSVIGDDSFGAIELLLGYNDSLVEQYSRQLFLDEMTSDMLDYFVQEMIGLFRYSGEADLHLVERTQKFVFGHRASPASIINAVEEYSPGGMPKILENETDAMFADISFTENYTSWQCQNTSGPWADLWIFPAVTVGQDSWQFFFTLVMYDTLLSNIQKVIDIVNQWKVAGVGYEILIYET